MYKSKGFEIETENFRLLHESVGSGVICELRPTDAGLVAMHFETHPETFLIATSGITAGPNLYPFRSGEPLLAIEWIREERKPMRGEPECNAYRFIFGQTRVGSCWGFDVTQRKGGPSSGQVSDHWMSLQTTAERFVSMAPVRDVQDEGRYPARIQMGRRSVRAESTPVSYL